MEKNILRGDRRSKKKGKKGFPCLATGYRESSPKASKGEKKGRGARKKNGRGSADVNRGGGKRMGTDARGLKRPT